MCHLFMFFSTRFPAGMIGAFVIILVGIATANNLAASQLVSGSQTVVDENKVFLHLFIANPAPSNLIVETTLPSKGRILDTSPAARKVDNETGKIKWLFKDARSGELSLSATLTLPLEGPVLTIVRYRSPIDGSYQELRISP